jgi:hypothetical protein
MDTIEDCSHGIAAYREKQGAALVIGDLYLATYGVLQCVFVQQDAVEDICKILGHEIQVAADPALKKIREIRNKTVGHPTDCRSAKDGRPFNFLVQVSLKIGSFQVLSVGSAGTDMQEVDCFKFLQDQENAVSGFLEAVLKKLADSERDHKLKFKEEGLEAIFQSANYYGEKIFEELCHPQSFQFALGLLRGINEMLSKFESALVKRGSDLTTYACLKDAYEGLKYPIQKLDEHLSSRSPLDQEAALIFLRFARDEVSGVKRVAREIDEEYSADASVISPPRGTT